MLVKFSTKNATVYGKDREAMEKKLGLRLSRYFQEDNAEVFVKISEEKLGFKAEITLPYYGFQIRAEASAKDGLFAAFDDAVDILERRMNKHKDKIVSRKEKGNGIVPEIPTAQDSEFELVRVKKFDVKPMTTQEAILNMDMLGHDFFVFFNSEENVICTVYKRKDGGYGLVVPQMN